MSYHIIYFAAFILLCNSCNPRYNSPKEYVISNIVNLNSLDSQTDTVEDLEIIGKHLKDKKIVLLGEQSHGDGTAFLFKTKLVKYLHEKLGFDLLIIESDFYGLYKINLNGKPSVLDLSSNIYSIWTASKEFSGLLKYLALDEVKLKVFGMDSRLVLEYSKNKLYDEIHGKIRELDNQERFNRILKNVLAKEYNDSVSEDDQIYFLKVLKELQKKESLTSFEIQTIKTLVAFADNAWNDKNGIKGIRDRQMADNVLWLHRRFPGKKIIVWGHNMHISKNTSILETYNSSAVKQGNTTAGKEILELIKEKHVYSIGFTSYQGYTGWYNAPKNAIPYPEKNSFERWIKGKNIELGFLDLSKMATSNLSDSSFHMKGGIHHSIKLPWAKIYDGVIYIEHMNAATSIDK